MERKNYLVEELSNEEKAYLRKIVISTRNTYLKENWKYINDVTRLDDNIVDYSTNINEMIFKNYEDSINDVIEFEKMFSM